MAFFNPASHALALELVHLLQARAEVPPSPSIGNAPPSPSMSSSNHRSGLQGALPVCYGGQPTSGVPESAGQGADVVRTGEGAGWQNHHQPLGPQQQQQQQQQQQNLSAPMPMHHLSLPPQDQHSLQGQAQNSQHQDHHQECQQQQQQQQPQSQAQPKQQQNLKQQPHHQWPQQQPQQQHLEHQQHQQPAQQQPQQLILQGQQQQQHFEQQHNHHHQHVHQQQQPRQHHHQQQLQHPLIPLQQQVMSLSREDQRLFERQPNETLHQQLQRIQQLGNLAKGLRDVLALLHLCATNLASQNHHPLKQGNPHLPPDLAFAPPSTPCSAPRRPFPAFCGTPETPSAPLLTQGSAHPVGRSCSQPALQGALLPPPVPTWGTQGGEMQRSMSVQGFMCQTPVGAGMKGNSVEGGGVIPPQILIAPRHGQVQGQVLGMPSSGSLGNADSNPAMAAVPQAVPGLFPGVAPVSPGPEASITTGQSSEAPGPVFQNQPQQPQVKEEPGLNASVETPLQDAPMPGIGRSMPPLSLPLPFLHPTHEEASPAVHTPPHKGVDPLLANENLSPFCTEQAPTASTSSENVDRIEELLQAKQQIEEALAQERAKSGVPVADHPKEEPSVPQKASKGTERKKPLRRAESGKRKPRDDQRFGEDGYVWRKYSHKTLRTTGMKRLYYACAEKEALGCRARKIVDKIVVDGKVAHASCYQTAYEFSHNHPATGPSRTGTGTCASTSQCPRLEQPQTPAGAQDSANPASHSVKQEDDSTTLSKSPSSPEPGMLGLRDYSTSPMKGDRLPSPFNQNEAGRLEDCEAPKDQIKCGEVDPFLNHEQIDIMAQDEYEFNHFFV